MYQLEENEIVHLYVVPEYAQERVRVWRIVNAILCTIVLLCLAVIPASADISPWVLSVPLERLPARTLTQVVAIEPTGTSVIPATYARGWITVYNGSILVQQLPKGFMLEDGTGQKFVTEETVTIPAARPPLLGNARVLAHALAAGADGNIKVGSIDTALGSSLMIRNLQAFSGGADSETQAIATAEDRVRARDRARDQLKPQTRVEGQILDSPCREELSEDGLQLRATWSCQFVRYRVPDGLRVLSMERVDNSVNLKVKR